MESNTSWQLSHQQQRFCDEYLVSFNAFKAAVIAGYSENTARKGELLHLPKIQEYLKAAMRKTANRLQITHDMILYELSKIAFSNMGNYYDEYAVLKPMNKLTNDEKAAISQYQILDAVDDSGHRIGELSKIKLHNKMAALDKIARHLGFYGVVGKKLEAGSLKQEKKEPERLEKESESRMSESPEVEKESESRMSESPEKESESPMSESPEVEKESESPEVVDGLHYAEPAKDSGRDEVRESAVIDRAEAKLPMDYPAAGIELEGLDTRTIAALEDVNISPGADVVVGGFFGRKSEVAAGELNTGSYAPVAYLA